MRLLLAYVGQGRSALKEKREEGVFALDIEMGLGLTPRKRINPTHHIYMYMCISGLTRVYIYMCMHVFGLTRV